MKKNIKERVVRIDSELFEELEEFINKKENKFKYSTRKQFIDIAVSELLKKEKKRK